MTVIISFLVIGSLILVLKNANLAPKFIDLTSTALGGYLALSVQGFKPVNTLSHNEE